MGGEEFREKKCKPHKCHPKMNLCSKFHPSWTKGKCSKSRGNVWGEEGEGGTFDKKNQTLKYYTHQIVSESGQWESVQIQRGKVKGEGLEKKM